MSRDAKRKFKRAVLDELHGSLLAMEVLPDSGTEVAEAAAALGLSATERLQVMDELDDELYRRTRGGWKP